MSKLRKIEKMLPPPCQPPLGPFFASSPHSPNGGGANYLHYLPGPLPGPCKEGHCKEGPCKEETPGPLPSPCKEEVFFKTCVFDVFNGLKHVMF